MTQKIEETVYPRYFETTQEYLDYYKIEPKPGMPSFVIFDEHLTVKDGKEYVGVCGCVGDEDIPTFINVEGILTTRIEMARKIRAHALKNWGKDGWDYIYEAWSEDNIIELLAFNDVVTMDKAMEEFSHIASIWDERRREIEGTAW